MGKKITFIPGSGLIALLFLVAMLLGTGAIYALHDLNWVVAVIAFCASAGVYTAAFIKADNNKKRWEASKKES